MKIPKEVREESNRISKELSRLVNNPTKEEIDKREAFVMRVTRLSPEDLMREFR